MSKLKLWKPFSLFMVLLLMSSLVAVVSATPVQANLSSVTVNPYDTRIIGLNTGYRITMTTGATLSAGDNITILFPTGTTVPDLSSNPERVFVQDTACSAVSVSLQQVTVTAPATMAPIVPGQQFTVTFDKACGITNPTTSGSRTVVVWTTVEPAHVTSSSYEITAVKVYTGAAKHSENATIQGAIDAAISGDTITVPAGTFTENLNVDKSLTLQGASSATTIVTAANASDYVFDVTASGVIISGFTATGATGTGTGAYAGINLQASNRNCNIHDNILTGNEYGILLIEPENTVTPGNNVFTNNTASGNSISGIEMQHSYGNTFVNNTASSNAGNGFRLDSARNNTFTGNTANLNGTVGVTQNGVGFFLVIGSGTGSNDNTFTNNTANQNINHGFRVDNSSRNTFTGNTANSNGYDGIKLKTAGNNTTMTGNNFSSNSIGVEITSGVDAGTTMVNDNNINENTSYGIYNAGTGTLNAKHNYWGHASGPSHDILSYGDNVTANNVTFQPWLVNTYTGTPPASEIHITTTSPLPDGNTGYAYSKAFAATGGSGTYTWAPYSGTVPTGLSFVGNNFSGTPTVVNTGGFNFYVQVNDGIQATCENFTMKVYGGALVITTTSPLPGGTKNVPYGPETLHAIGGTGSYTWSIYTGALPDGLSLGLNDGKITGTPTVAGPFNFNVKVECGGSTPGYKDLSITISAPSVGGQRLIGVAPETVSTGGGGGCTNVMIQRFLASTTGSITQFRVKASASGNVKVAIYSDNSSAPYNLLSSVTSTSVSSGWNTIPITSTNVTSSAFYWLAVVSDSCNLYYHSSDPSATVRWKPSTYSTWTYPTPAGSGWNTQTGYTYFMAGWAAVTVSAPTVTNSPVSNKTQTSATLNGEVTVTGDENPTVIIYWGDNDGTTNAYNWDHSVNLGTKGVEAFSTGITGLSANTDYYYRCFAANSGGPDWADSTESFKTLALSPPTVTNSTGASSVTATSARLNGAITATGGVDPTVIVYWGDNDGTTTSSNWDNSVNLGVKGAVTFYTDITDLNSGTKYYYRCYGSNSGGNAWAGSSGNFTTASGGVADRLIGVAPEAVSTGGGGGCTNVMMQRFQASGTGSIIEFRVKASASGAVKVAIYDDSAGSPGALRNAVNTSTPVSAGAWTSIPITSTSVNSGTYYWLAVVSDSCNLYYHSSDTSATVRWKPSTYSTWTYPDPAGSGWNTQTGYTYFIAGWSATVSAPPAPPTIVAPKKAITFEWNISTGATKYKLQVNPASDFTGTDVFNAEVSTTSKDVTLTVGTPYYWRVKAGNAGGWSAWSATGSVTP